MIAARCAGKSVDPSRSSEHADAVIKARAATIRRGKREETEAPDDATEAREAEREWEGSAEYDAGAITDDDCPCTES